METQTQRTDRTDVESEDRRSFAVNALIGAVVSVVFTFIPFSPVVGGAAAGYLQRGTTEDGAKVGGLSGLIAALPVFAILTLIFGVLSFVAVGSNEPGGAVLFGGIFWLVAFFVALYTVGLGAIGGVIGVYVVNRDREPSSVPTE